MVDESQQTSTGGNILDNAVTDIKLIDDPYCPDLLLQTLLCNYEATCEKIPAVFYNLMASKIKNVRKLKRSKIQYDPLKEKWHCLETSLYYLIKLFLLFVVTLGRVCASPRLGVAQLVISHLGQLLS